VAASRHDATRYHAAVAPAFALEWVTERNLLEPYAIMDGAPRDMKMAVDDYLGAKARVPVRRGDGAAPLRELGMK